MVFGRRLASPPLLLALVLSTLASAEPPRVFTETQSQGARLFYHDSIPIAVLSGAPEQIGRQHAALLGKPAAQSVTLAKRFTTEMGMGFLWPLMVQAGHTLVKNAPERYQQEMAAMTAAAQLDAGDVTVGNTLLELRRMGCSALIIQPERSSTGGPLFGRNFDFPTLGELDKYSVLLIYRPEGRRAFASIAFPGAIGVFSGMNDAGLAVATLDVNQAADGSPKFEPKGAPLAFVFRRLLEECSTVAEAEALLRGITPTTWMNLAVCDRRDAAVFEITPRHIGRRAPEQGVLACTNHFRTPGLVVDESCWRYPELMEADHEASLGVEQVRQRLHAANQGDLTLQTMVFEPQTLALHVAFGKPPTSAYPLTRIDLAPLLTGEAAQRAAPTLAK